jgi:putative tryptophan/tyrosine transport system substrate-binding protein
VIPRYAVCLLVALGLSPSPVLAKTVIVLSRSFAPYEQVQQKISKSLNEPDAPLNVAGDAEKGKLIMQDLSRTSPDLVITIGWEASAAAKNSLSGVPVVYTMLLEKMDMPGKVFSGVVVQTDAEHQFQVIKKILPNCKSIGIIYDPYSSSSKINEARASAEKYGLELSAVGISSLADLPEALKKMTRGRIDMLWSVVDPTVSKPEAVQQMIQHSLREKLPFFAITRSHVDAGAFAALSISYQDIGDQTAELAQKILRTGTSSPVEFPAKQVLFINAKTREAIDFGALPPVPDVKLIEE